MVSKCLSLLSQNLTISTMVSQYNLVESVKGNVRIKVDLEQAMRAQRGARGVGLAVLFLYPRR
jgi:hypothetical protein